ncbi:hypothetical protein [Rossellomorea marisflavi]|uniref:hypothetical protein n=1 Tax=Rossellomorea marisflavi TaxID=189381 RepID=UPI003D2F4BEC
MKHGDLVMSLDGLVGRLMVDPDTKECEIHSVDDKAGKWVVRAWNLNDLNKSKRWQRYYVQDGETGRE